MGAVEILGLAGSMSLLSGWRLYLCTAATQVVAFLLGGGGALLSHGAKASARALINVSPEPYSNVAVSAGEDVATGGLIALALINPVLSLLVACAALIFAVVLLIFTRRLLRRLLRVRDEVLGANP